MYIRRTDLLLSCLVNIFVAAAASFNPRSPDPSLLGKRIVDKNGVLLNAIGYAELVVQDHSWALKKRQDQYIGSWSLRALTCPADLKNCGKARATNACCTQGTYCVENVWGEVLCCPTKDNCIETARSFPKCPDLSWSLWKGGRDDYFCCLPGLKGYLTPNEGGACGSEDLVLTEGQSVSAWPQYTDGSQQTNSPKTTSPADDNDGSSNGSPNPTGSASDGDGDDKGDNGSNSNSKSTSLSVGAIAGIAAGGIILIILAIIGIIFGIRHGTKKGTQAALAAFQAQQQQQQQHMRNYSFVGHGNGNSGYNNYPPPPDTPGMGSQVGQGYGGYYPPPPQGKEGSVLDQKMVDPRMSMGGGVESDGIATPQPQQQQMPQAPISQWTQQGNEGEVYQDRHEVEGDGYNRAEMEGNQQRRM
ncbi:hypothetical protein BDZ91DRAFT_720285 [Kalaharituber pfeilii]|nr:hypothetical protein BDZ91DRAFT_720285 [Kalaharituber pfeilii]